MVRRNNPRAKKQVKKSFNDRAAKKRERAAARALRKRGKGNKPT
jgi:hypothetical protein